MNKPKLLVIFPKYAARDTTHYSYWYPVFSEAGKKLDLAIIFESKDSQPNLKNVTIYSTIDLPKPLNLLVRAFVIIKALLAGYRQVYIHYSYHSLFIVKLLSFFLPAKIYYWNCEYYTSRNQSDHLLPWALRFTDVLVTGSPMIADQYHKIFNLSIPIEVVSNYVSPFSVQSLELTKGQTHILFVHRLTPRKGSLDLPKIISSTLSLIPKAHFHIVGDGPDRQSIEQQLNHSGLSKSVTFYGSLPRSKTVSLFKSCDVFIMPSRSEGFPRVVLEAMLYKIPIVATNVGNVSEITSPDQRPYLTPPLKPVLFAQTIAKQVHNRHKIKLVKTNYNKVINHYNLHNSTSAFISLFSQIKPQVKRKK